MNKVAFLLILAFLSPLAGAQGDATVTGRIVDGQTRQALPFVTVTVAGESDGVELTGAITDEAGRFIIAGLPRGQFTVNAAFVGYLKAETVILIGERNDNYDLGDIALQNDAGALEEVVATARQEILEANLDRRVFNLDDNISGSAGSVLDAMRSLPGVTVEQDGRIRLRGSDRVTVLIEGKQSSLTGFGNQTGLDSIPAGNIESIEIINNPSARYDSAGMAGIINIVYREDQEMGLQLDAGLTVGVGQLSRRKDDLPTDIGSFSSNPKLNPSVNLIYNTPDVSRNLHAEVLVQEHLPNNEFTTRFYDDGSTTFSQVPENRKQTQYIVRGGIDKVIDDFRTLSFSSILDFETHTDIAEVPFIDGATMQRYRFWFWTEKEDTGLLNADITYKRAFEQPGRELSMSLQYTRGWEDEAYFLNDRSILRQADDATHLVAEENTLPFQIDYIKPLRSGRVETGAKLQKRWIPITYDVVRGVGSIIYPGLGDWSEWHEDIYAAYVNYVRERPRYAAEVGFRVEQTEVEYDLPEQNIYYDRNDAYDYFEPFPNIRLTYNIDDTNRLAVYYNNRVDRPGEPELRIFPKYDDPELLKVGNPYLRPQFTETYELSYERLWNSGSAIVSSYRKDIESPFTRVFSIDNSNPNYDIVNRIYQNVGSGTNTGIEVLLAQDVGDYWELSGSVNWYENSIDADRTTLLFPVQRPFTVRATEEDTWDFKLSSLLTLPRGLRAQLSLVHYAERNIAQGVEAARSSIDLGLSKPAFNGNGEVVVSITDILNTFGIEQRIDGDGFDAVYQNFYETQTVRVGMTYQF